MTSVLAKRMRLHSANFRFENVFGRKQDSSEVGTAQPHFFAIHEVMHTPTSDSSGHFDKNTYQIRPENKNGSARHLLPATCLSDGCRFAASRSRLNYSKQIDSFQQERIR